MSDDESKPNNPDDEKNFSVDRAKTGRAACKKCKQKIDSNTLRLAKHAYNPFGTGKMKQWHHVECLFEVFKKQRASTAKIEHYDDVGGWDKISDQDKEEIFKFLPDSARKPRAPVENLEDKKTSSDKKDDISSKPSSSSKIGGGGASGDESSLKNVKDNLFREYRRLCVDIASASSYTMKTAIAKERFTKGADGNGFKGDLILWLRLLLPGFIKRIYNLQSKQLIKLFSRLFGEDQDEMLEDLESGDVAETIRVFFEKSSKCIPTKKSTLTLQEVDNFLEYLSKLTREEDQLNHFNKIAAKCTSNDMKMIVRLIKHDLRINAGAKHILEAVHPDAYEAFQASRDITSVINRLLNPNSSGTVSNKISKDNISISLLTPVLPMLAEACKSVGQAMKKCPNGMFSEIKYDGERVQVHKQGSEFKYFSRSLKPVLPHKVNHFKDYIPKAFPHGKDLILDSEILMVDLNTGKPLPFGSLGVHKKNEFKDANVCLFVFDCLYYNNESLLCKPLKERKRILKENMTEIPNHIVFSEMEVINEPKDLEAMMTKVFRQGLEGLVLKNVMGIYEPGKRHWLKVKKDYLFDGAMADTADLVVIGAWYGTGQKGGMMSVFLMGCFDPSRDKWCTVTKVHTGHDDKTLESLQTELDMIKISKDPSKVPNWLLCTKTMIPDFVARDPKAQPVWEITGAEFTKHDVHTAAGISVRFPRVTRIRSDKDWKTATSLPELKVLFEKSKDNQDFTLLSHSSSDASSSAHQEKKRKPDSDSPSEKKKKRLGSSTPEKKKQLTLFDTAQKLTTSPVAKPMKRPRDDECNREEDDAVPARDIEYGRKPRNSVDNSDEAKMKKLKMLKRPLPDVFVGVKLFIPEEEEEEIRDLPLLQRYFIAFGGKLLKPIESDQATHIVKSSNKIKSEFSKNTKVIELDWLWDSIKLKRQQDCTFY